MQQGRILFRLTTKRRISFFLHGRYAFRGRVNLVARTRSQGVQQPPRRQQRLRRRGGVHPSMSTSCVIPSRPGLGWAGEPCPSVTRSPGYKKEAKSSSSGGDLLLYRQAGRHVHYGKGNADFPLGGHTARGTAQQRTATNLTGGVEAKAARGRPGDGAVLEAGGCRQLCTQPGKQGTRSLQTGRGGSQRPAWRPRSPPNFSHNDATPFQNKCCSRSITVAGRCASLPQQQEEGLFWPRAASNALATRRTGRAGRWLAWQPRPSGQA